MQCAGSARGPRSGHAGHRRGACHRVFRAHVGGTQLGQLGASRRELSSRGAWHCERHFRGRRVFEAIGNLHRDRVFARRQSKVESDTSPSAHRRASRRETRFASRRRPRCIARARWRPRSSRLQSNLYSRAAGIGAQIFDSRRRVRDFEPVAFAFIRMGLRGDSTANPRPQSSGSRRRPASSSCPMNKSAA